MSGFFSDAELASSKPEELMLPKCGKCQLFRTCRSPYIKVAGGGRRKILVVGEAPGREEDEQAEAFVGPSGQELEHYMDSVGLDLNEDCWKYNAVICRPPKNAKPTENQIKYCRPNLARTIKELNPEIIVPLGAVAMTSLLKLAWRAEKASMFRWAGWKIPCQRLNAWIMPTFHPSFVMRETEERRDPVPGMYFKRHLKAVARTKGRPWKKVPDYRSAVTPLMDTREAADVISRLTRAGNPVAFDYETNMLKPDCSRSRIVTCSVSDGETSIAFPWHGKAITAMKDLLKSPTPKYGFNIDFEQRWTRRHLGCWVKKWHFCGMIGTHWLDNRENICSLEFQAFVRFGIPPWDEGVTPYLRSPGGNTENKIDLLVSTNLPGLLEYNAMDSLFEYMVATDEMKRGYPFPEV